MERGQPAPSRAPRYGGVLVIAPARVTGRVITPRSSGVARVLGPAPAGRDDNRSVLERA
jgi:hypothetical protein